MMQQLKQQVCDMALQSYREGLFAGTSGNLSAYNREEDYLVITPSSIPYEGMTAEDMMVLRPDGTVLEGKHRPSSEWRMHAAIYQQRPDLGAIVHTHSPYATSYAVEGKEIPAVLIEMAAFLGGEVPLAAFALPGTWEVGQTALEALRERAACLLQNHGVLAVGSNLQRAHLCAVYVEDAAKICTLAEIHGPLKPLDEETVRKIRES